MRFQETMNDIAAHLSAHDGLTLSQIVSDLYPSLSAGDVSYAKRYIASKLERMHKRGIVWPEHTGHNLYKWHVVE